MSHSALRSGKGGPALPGIVLRASVAFLFVVVHLFCFAGFCFCFYLEGIDVMVNVPMSKYSLSSVALYPKTAAKYNWSRLLFLFLFFNKEVKESI